MSEPTWTEKELAEFECARWQTGSLSNYERVTGRLALWALASKHGREKCDAMFAEIKRREMSPAYSLDGGE